MQKQMIYEDANVSRKSSQVEPRMPTGWNNKLLGSGGLNLSANRWCFNVLARMKADTGKFVIVCGTLASNCLRKSVNNYSRAVNISVTRRNDSR